MNALINECKKKGNGLAKVYLNELRECFHYLTVEENELKDGLFLFSRRDEAKCTDWKDSIG